jgi:hypothetical protein
MVCKSMELLGSRTALLAKGWKVVMHGLKWATDVASPRRSYKLRQ